MIDRWITGASYRLGEQTCKFDEINNIEQLLTDHNLTTDVEVLGLGNYHKTKNLYQLVSSTIAATLDKAQLSGTCIDSVIFCSCYYNHDLITQNRGYGQALIEHGIEPKSVVCVSGTGCVSLLSGIELASAQMATQNLHRVLLINTDHIKSTVDADRFVGFTVLSDSVSSVILSDESLGLRSLKVSGFYKKIDIGQMKDGINMENFRKNRVIEPVLKESGLGQINIKKIFSNNIFLPIKVVKEQGYGFSSEQLYIDNVSRTSHCLGSDTLINLSDYLQKNPDCSGNYLMYAEADGHAASLVVSRYGGNRSVY